MSAANQSLPFRKGVLDAAAIRAQCPHFRVLVIGKANAGKTTILRKVCNAGPDSEPVIHDAKGNEVIYYAGRNKVIQEDPPKSRWFSLSKLLRRTKGPSAVDPSTEFKFRRMKGYSGVDPHPSTEPGDHNIEYQLNYFGSNFIFHDSGGIESGSENELKIVKDFIQRREQMVDLKDQLHVIWYCVPMDDQCPISGAEKTFFSLGTGRVPIVLIFTKFDALEDKCYNKLRDQGKSHEAAESQLPELVNKIFQDEYLACVQGFKLPPKAYVCLGEMDKEENQCPELSEITADLLDDDLLLNLFDLTQQNNLDLCIKQGIEYVWEMETMEDILELVGWFPNCWDSSKYKLGGSRRNETWDGSEEEWIRMDMERSRMLERDEEERIIMLKERIIEERIDRYRERIKRNEEEEERNETYWERDERRFREEERERNRETNKLNRRIERIRMNWWLHRSQILDILTQQYPFVFSQDARKKYTGLFRLQLIAVVTVLLEHSFWFSGDNMKTQLSYAIKSFKSQQYTSFNIMGAGIATAFNNASHKQNPAWLIRWVISNKLKH